MPMTNPPSPNEALREALAKIMPIRVHNGPDYAEVYFADGSTHSTQAMTMNPDDWTAINDAFAALSPSPASSPVGEVERLRKIIDDVFAENVTEQVKRVRVFANPSESPSTWISRVRKAALLAALSPLSGEPVKRIEDGHADTEGEAAEMWEHLNCPACGGSGHIQDAHGKVSGEPAKDEEPKICDGCAEYEHDCRCCSGDASGEPASVAGDVIDREGIADAYLLSPFRPHNGDRKELLAVNPNGYIEYIRMYKPFALEEAQQIADFVLSLPTTLSKPTPVEAGMKGASR